MPVTNTRQARIELSDGQYKAIAELLADAAKRNIPMVFIEETNLSDTVAIGSTLGFTLVTGKGGLHHVSGRGVTGSNAEDVI